MDGLPETVLLTGAAGFIGSHLSEHLVGLGVRVVGVDNFCDFYDPGIKRLNIRRVQQSRLFELVEADIRDASAMNAVLSRTAPGAVLHVAAMAGVRPSILDPVLYTSVNVGGTATLLEAAARHRVGGFVFASSSSVYGNPSKVPFAEDDPVDNPVSPYAATKRAGELLCHAWWHLNRIPVSCLRFFTVFGPRQRPDLAISRFLRNVAAGKEIEIYGDGSASRDYTYVDDIVSGTVAALQRMDGFRVYNLGGSHPHTLDDLVSTIGRVTGLEPRIRRLPMQPGDVERTFADVSLARAELAYEPRVSLEEGVSRQWAWTRETDVPRPG
jgi:UDP-glucuronate 4-epimerase